LCFQYAKMIRGISDNHHSFKSYFSCYQALNMGRLRAAPVVRPVSIGSLVLMLTTYGQQVTFWQGLACAISAKSLFLVIIK
jgi:hypothetical protein